MHDQRLTKWLVANIIVWWLSRKKGHHITQSIHDPHFKIHFQMACFLYWPKSTIHSQMSNERPIWWMMECSPRPHFTTAHSSHIGPDGRWNVLHTQLDHKNQYMHNVYNNNFWIYFCKMHILHQDLRWTRPECVHRGKYVYIVLQQWASYEGQMAPYDGVLYSGGMNMCPAAVQVRSQ